MIDEPTLPASIAGQQPALTSPKIGDRVTIEGTVISFLSGGAEARVRLDNDMPFSPAVVSAAPGALTVVPADTRPRWAKRLHRWFAWGRIAAHRAAAVGGR